MVLNGMMPTLPTRGYLQIMTRTARICLESRKYMIISHMKDEFFFPDVYSFPIVIQGFDEGTYGFESYLSVT